MNRKELLVSWLNDAYAMEKALVPILENHADDASGHPELERRIRGHAQQTRRHAELIEQCIERLGESRSVLKSATARLFGGMKAPSTGAFGDELVKNGISDYTTEHFEIASYSALIRAAHEAGHQEIAQICEGILEEEKEMARFLEDQLPNAVQEEMNKAATAEA